MSISKNLFDQKWQKKLCLLNVAAFSDVSLQKQKFDIEIRNLVHETKSNKKLNESIPKTWK